MDSLSALGTIAPLGRVSQVPRPICRRAPSPPTPESPATASARCFVAGAGFSRFGSLATLAERNEAESGSLALRLTPSPREASPAGLLRRMLAGLHVNGQFTW